MPVVAVPPRKPVPESYCGHDEGAGSGVRRTDSVQILFWGARETRLREGGEADDTHRNHVADRPPDQGADARVEHVLEKDVLRVLGADGAGLEQGEAALHEEDEEAAKHCTRRGDRQEEDDK